MSTLVARHRDIGSLLQSPDGWLDTLQYTLDLRSLGKDGALVREVDDIDTSRISHLRIGSIGWVHAGTR